MQIELSTKTVEELQNFILNYQRKGMITDPFYARVITERNARKNTPLDFIRTRDFILAAAREERCVSYKSIAELNGAEWSRVRYRIFDLLGELVDWGHAHKMPMLSAIVVDSALVDKKTMSDTALAGFVRKAETLAGKKIDPDPKKFLKDEQTALFRYAQEHPNL